MKAGESSEELSPGELVAGGVANLETLSAMGFAEGMRSKLPWVLVGLLVATNLLTAYIVIDQALWLDDLVTSVESAREQAELLSSLTLDLERGMSKDHVLEVIRVQHPDALYKQSPSGSIEIGGLELVFEGEELSKIERW